MKEYASIQEAMKTDAADREIVSVNGKRLEIVRTERVVSGTVGYLVVPGGRALVRQRRGWKAPMRRLEGE